MRAYRQRRRPIGTFMVLVLLCAQWLVSAYACPIPAVRNVAPVAAAAALPPCHLEAAADALATADADNPALCKAHCDEGQQVPAQTAPSDAATPATGWFIVVTPVDLAPLTAATALQRDAGETGAPPGWPPLHLSLQVLRN